jgi:hypothetical protein
MIIFKNDQLTMKDMHCSLGINLAEVQHNASPTFVRTPIPEIRIEEAPIEVVEEQIACGSSCLMFS